MRIQLRSAVARDKSVSEVDTLLTKSALEILGHYDFPDGGLTPYPDEGMFAGLRAFQQSKGLSVDGLMKVDGPTLRALNEEVDRTVADIPAVALPEMQPQPVLLDCETRYQQDISRCNRIKNWLVREACYASAAERLAACRRGKSSKDLDTEL